MLEEPTLFGRWTIGSFNTLLGSIRIKPELKRNVEDLRLDAARGVAGLGHLSELGGVANHVGVAELMASGLGQLVPDVEPRLYPCL